MFNTKLPLYAMMILFSLLANVIVVINICKKYNFSKDEIIGALVYENIGIIFGAKLLTYIQNYKEYTNFDVISLGLSSYGAIIGAIICLIIFGLQFKKSLKNMLFTFMPSIPLMYAIGKIGCFLAGCCYGIEYSGMGSISYKYSTIAPNYTQLFPIQLLETITFILIFIYMIYKIFKKQFQWKTLGISFILCGFAKFVLDYLRASHINIFLSLNQLISLLFILIGFYMIKKYKTDVKEFNLKCINCNNIVQSTMKYCPYCSCDLNKQIKKINKEKNN